MEIKSVSGRATILGLDDSEKKAYREFEETQKDADKKYDYNSEEKFLSLVSPFLRKIGLNPKGRNYSGRGDCIEVRCEDFEMGDSILAYDKKIGHGFIYTPVVVFGLNGTIKIEDSYAQAPRTRTTVSIMDDIVRMLYPQSGDGLKTPKIEMTEERDPRIHISSVEQIQPVLFRLQYIFRGLRNDRLGALIHLHYEAENQDRENRFTANLLRKTYRDLLETLVR